MGRDRLCQLRCSRFRWPVLAPIAVAAASLSFGMTPASETVQAQATPTTAPAPSPAPSSSWTIIPSPDTASSQGRRPHFSVMYPRPGVHGCRPLLRLGGENPGRVLGRHGVVDRAYPGRRRHDERAYLQRPQRRLVHLGRRLHFSGRVRWGGRLADLDRVLGRLRLVDRPQPQQLARTGQLLGRGVVLVGHVLHGRRELHHRAWGRDLGRVLGRLDLVHRGEPGHRLHRRAVQRVVHLTLRPVPPSAKRGHVSASTALSSRPGTARPGRSSPAPTPAPAPTCSTTSLAPRPAQCVAVGTFFNGSEFQLLSMSWDGSSWSLLPNPGLHADGTGVTCSSATDCTEVGASGLVNTWDGKTWTLGPDAGFP